MEVPGVSMELCGGTHVSNTSEIRVFKIISEQGIASGIRRIEAIAGEAFIEYINARESQMKNLCSMLKVSSLFHHCGYNLKPFQNLLHCEKLELIQKNSSQQDLYLSRSTITISFGLTVQRHIFHMIPVFTFGYSCLPSYHVELHRYGKSLSQPEPLIAPK